VESCLAAMGSGEAGPAELESAQNPVKTIRSAKPGPAKSGSAKSGFAKLGPAEAVWAVPDLAPHSTIPAAPTWPQAREFEIVDSGNPPQNQRHAEAENTLKCKEVGAEGQTATTLGCLGWSDNGFSRVKTLYITRSRSRYSL
jgi:hypothetical protein